MAVTVPDASMQAASQSTTLGGTPLSTDVVVYVVGSARTPPRNVVDGSVTGQGATWSDLGGSARAHWFLGVNPSVGGTVTCTFDGGTPTAFCAAWLIRGLTDDQVQALTVVENAAATALTGPTHDAALEQIVMAIARGAANPVTFPSASTPATGWTANSGTAGSAKAIYRIPTATESHRVDATDGTSGLMIISQLVLGPAPPPNPPTGVAQTAATRATASFGWTAPAAGESPTSYEYRIDGGTPVDVGLVTSAMATGLTPDTTYDVEVRSIAATGESTWTSPVTLTTDDLLAPTDVAQTAATRATASFDWTPITGDDPDSYEYRIDGGTPEDVGLVTSAMATGLSPGTTYDVEVRAVAEGFFSAWSVPAELTTDDLLAPTDLIVSGATNSSVILSWTPPTGDAPDSYEYRVDGGAPEAAGSGTSHTVSGLAASTTYTFEVRAVAEGFFSAWSTPADGTTTAPFVSTSACFAPVRGSAVRVTRLGPRGQVLDPIEFAVSKSITKVTISEVITQGTNEILRSPEEERRLRFVRNTQTIRYLVGIEFLRVDPGVFSLVTGVALVYDANGDVVGFDSSSRAEPVSFTLEVWSKLAGPRCADGSQAWGYTLFPHLRGGHLNGFTFANGRVSFTLTGAQTRRSVFWGVGPHDIEGPFERLIEPVSRNTSWRMFVTPGVPPVEVCGEQETTDVLDNGTAANPMPDPSALLFVDGGGAETGPFIIDGGRAT